MERGYTPEKVRLSFLIRGQGPFFLPFRRRLVIIKLSFPVALWSLVLNIGSTAATNPNTTTYLLISEDNFAKVCASRADDRSHYRNGSMFSAM